MDNNPNEGLVMVIQYDGSPAIPLTDNGVMVSFYVDDKGFPVYITSKKHARYICAARPDRYRLYRSVTLDVHVKMPNGAMKYTKVTPWYYRAETVEVGDIGEESSYETRITWFEDPSEKNIVSATPEFITGKKPPQSQASSDLQAVKVENTGLKNQVAELTKLVDALTENVKKLTEASAAKAAQDRPLTAANKKPEANKGSK